SYDTFNIGDQVPLTLELLGAPDGTIAEVREATNGVRPQGAAETQNIRLLVSDGGAMEDVTGYWRLAFAASSYGNFIASDASAEDVKHALEQLPTMRKVSVTRREISDGDTFG